MKGTISVAVVDSYSLILYAISNQLQLSGFDVSIEAKDSEDFMAKIANSRSIPKVCILDIDTPDIEEFATARDIKLKYPEIKILAYTLFEREYSEVKSYGIDLFVKKNCSIEHIKNIICDLVGG